MVQSLGKAIKITPETKTLFTISYRNASPKLAYDVVQTLLSMFVESATGANRSDMENARRFLDQQIGSYNSNCGTLSGGEPSSRLNTSICCPIRMAALPAWIPPAHRSSRCKVTCRTPS